jgi:hypothetical protein
LLTEKNKLYDFDWHGAIFDLLIVCSSCKSAFRRSVFVDES